MKMILDLLLPREVEFFKLMNQQADILCEASRNLKKLVTEIGGLDEDEIRQHVAQIKEMELRGDEIERHIINELDTTFITPLDREDIHSIASGVDRSLDILNEVAQKVEIYKIGKVPPNVGKFATIIVDISCDLRRLIGGLEDKKEMKILLKEMHKLENESDYLFHTTLAELFDEEDPKYVIKFKDIYENLEDTVDSVDHVGKLIRGVMVKRG